MPRRKMAFARNHYYHIYNRGVDKRVIFQEADNYLFVLRQIKKYARQFNIAIIAYSLMPNHYHFLVRQDGTELISTLFQRVFNSYSKAFNKRNKRSGALFEGRFRSVHVDNEAYLSHLCVYIHANPVKDGFVATPESWPYSNYLEWLGQREGTLVDLQFVEAQYPNRAEYALAVKNYLLRKTDLPEDIKIVLEKLES